MPSLHFWYNCKTEIAALYESGCLYHDCDEWCGPERRGNLCHDRLVSNNNRTTVSDCKDTMVKDLVMPRILPKHTKRN